MIKEKEKLGYKFNIASIINMLRMTLSDNTVEDIEKLCNYFDITCLKNEKAISSLVFSDLKGYNRNIDDSSIIDFTDMIYLPVDLDMKLEKYDVVFIDEAQDLNKAQKKFIDKLVADDGRKIIVGDPKQAIYSFAGADSQGFFDYQKQKNTITLPLSVSFRCPKLVVEEAKKIYENIEAFYLSPDGIVRHGDLSEAQTEDMVICRNTKPLIRAYFNFLEMNKKAFVLGKDIEKGLLNVVVKVSEYSKEEGFNQLKLLLAQTAKELEEKGVQKPTEHNKYTSLFEKVEVLKLIGTKCSTMKEIETKILNIFDDSVAGIKLCTGHKSKGLEADRVFFIEKFEGTKLIPSKYAKSAW